MVDRSEKLSFMEDSEEEEEYITAGESDDEVIVEKTYKILNQEEIKKRVEEEISAIRAVLFLNKGSAFALLRKYGWSVTSARTDWLADEEKVRKAVGLFAGSGPSPSKDEKNCKICSQEIKNDFKMFSAACGDHQYCHNCWKIYITQSISNGGAKCLNLRCPEVSCNAIVEMDIIEILASDEDKEKYYNYFYRSYVDDNKDRKWCPSPECGLAVECSGNSSDVVCDCSIVLCWACGEERHTPVDCEMVRKWVKRNKIDAETAMWVLANTKPCPKCKLPIEKNRGCNRMRCGDPDCDFRFCWFCLEHWSYDHPRDCDKREDIKENSCREMGRGDMERYGYYYTKWTSMDTALADLKQQQTQNVNIEKLKRMKKESSDGMIILSEAWEQIFECRRILKWTCVYAYYSAPDDENDHTFVDKTKFLEYLQDQAESALKKLHESTVKICKTVHSCTQLIRLTKITKSLFDNLVLSLENNLSELEIDTFRCCLTEFGILKSSHADI